MSHAKQYQVRPTGTPWTFSDLELAADDPDPRAEKVQAVLDLDPARGFRLFARQGRAMHPVTHRGHAVRFRTIEGALTALADVAYLDPEIVVHAGGWTNQEGPV